MDSSVREQILEQVDSAYTDYYREHVRLLSEYTSTAALADETVLRRGGTAFKVLVVGEILLAWDTGRCWQMQALLCMCD